MRRLGLVFLAWWFAVMGGDAAGNVIGPLSSEAACDYFRRLAEKYGTRSSLCWYVSDLQEKKTL